MAVGISDTFLFIFVISMLAFVACDSDITLNKCCEKGERFDAFYQCVKIDKYDLLNDTDRSPVDVKYSRFNFNFNYAAKPCGGRRFMFVFPEHFELQPNGSLTYLDDDSNFKASYSKNSFCVEKQLGDSVIENVAYLCPCAEHICIFKCCLPSNQLYPRRGKKGKVNSADCGRSSDIMSWHHSVLNGSAVTKYHEVFHDLPTCQRKLYLEGEYELREDGSLLSQSDGIIQPGEYCGDYTKEANDSRNIVIMACDIPPTISPTRIVIYGILSLISVCFLGVTVFLYCWLPELSGLSSKSLCAHAGCLIVAHVCAFFNQLIIKHMTACGILGYLMQFSFLAAFFWLNAMCVDMSWTFSGVRAPSGSRADRDRRRFIWYSLYAWGGAAAMTAAALVVDYSPGVPTSSPFKPNLGAVKCWFNTSQSVLLYFYGPMGLLLLANLGFFIYTSWRIVVLRRGAGALNQEDSARHGGSRSPSNKERQKFVLYGKLFSLMGITWLTEIISWAVGGPTYIWYFTDSINLLRAVFIFIIFCWKPKVWAAVKKRLACFRSCSKIAIGKKKSTPSGIPYDPTSSSTNCNKSSSCRTDCVEMEHK